MPDDASYTKDRTQGGEREGARSRPTKFVLTSGDIRDLYETARTLGGMGGAPYLNRLFDAETALNSGLLGRVQEILATTRREFEKSHTRLLRFRADARDASKQSQEDSRLGARKKQVEEVLRLLDEYREVVERMASAIERRDAEAEPRKPPETPPQAPADLPAGFQDAFTAERTTDAQFMVATRYFRCTAVASAGDIRPASLYFLRTRTSGYVLQTAADPVRDVVRMSDVFSGSHVRPQPVEALVEQGRKGKFLALTRREDEEGASPGQEDDRADDAGPGGPSESPAPDPLEAQNELLDRQLFNVLMTSVKQSGLPISTELIVQVRDNEFRKGEYLDAFEKLNQLATRFEVAAARRKEELRQHDQWLNSGQSGLSLREVDEAKLRNANERTRLEHASHRFGLVVEPLRILASRN